MNRFAFALAFGLSLASSLGGCKKKEADQAPAPSPASNQPAPPPPVVVDAPAAPVYSAEAAKAALASLSTCTSQYSCDGYKTLLGFGQPVVPDVMAALAEPTTGKDQRRILAELVGELKPAGQGPALVAMASSITDDSMLQSDLYKAAGATGGKETFDALIAEYAKALADSDDDRDIPLRGGLRAFPAESVAWAKENLPKAKDDHTAYADLITDSGAAGDLPVIVEMLGQTKDPMARHRLAAKAIELGDKGHFAVFVDGLKSKDVYDRSDAANFLAKVAEQAPEDLKPQLVELLQKGKAGDSGGLTAMGYDEALKKLGATP